MVDACFGLTKCLRCIRTVLSVVLVSTCPLAAAGERAAANPEHGAVTEGGKAATSEPIDDRQASYGSPFPVMEETTFYSRVRSSGKTLVQGFYVDWRREVERLRGSTTPDRVVVDLCFGSQYEAIETFFDVSNEFVISPFIDLCQEGPKEEDKVWPAFDHPLINRLRKLRNMTPRKRIYATIPVSRTGEHTFPPEVPQHSTTAAEAQWMICAVVGSDWDGVLSFNFDPAAASAYEVSRLQQAIEQHAGHIAAASPVDWVSSREGQPVSALFSPGRLYVVLLESTYYTFDEEGVCNIPVGRPPSAEREIAITLPEGCLLESADSLLEGPVSFHIDGSVARVKHTLEGGGDILVFGIRSPDSMSEASPAENADSEGNAGQ